MEITGTIIITLFVVFIVSVILQNLFGKGSAEASDWLSSTKDYDNDGTANFYDKCICLSGDQKNEGCPINEPTTGDLAIKREKSAKEKFKSGKQC